MSLVWLMDVILTCDGGPLPPSSTNGSRVGLGLTAQVAHFFLFMFITPFPAVNSSPSLLEATATNMLLYQCHVTVMKDNGPRFALRFSYSSILGLFLYDYSFL